MAHEELAKLIEKIGELDEQDAQVIIELAKKYGIPVDVKGGEQAELTGKAPQPALPEKPQSEPIQQGEKQPIPVDQALEQPIGQVEQGKEQQGQPIEVPQPNLPPATAGVEEELAEQVGSPKSQPNPMDMVQGLISPLLEKLGGLEAKLASLEGLLQQVAVREPVSETEAEELAMKQQVVGQRSKGQPANVPEQKVTSDLIRKLGGLSK
jgi:hypothetical protein